VYRNEQNLSVVRAKILALNQSVYAATGGTACVLNTYAGGTYNRLFTGDQPPLGAILATGESNASRC
jgi:hypothetical protein